MKFVEFVKRPVSRVEYYGPIIIGVIVSGVYGAFCLRQIDKIKENEVETKEEDEA